MKRSTTSWTVVAILAAAAYITPAYAVECELRPIEPSVTCEGVGIEVVWGYFCNCGTPTFTIERACCPSGRWVTIATNVTGGSYLDVSPSFCMERKYRITLNPPAGCSCTDICQYETPCIACP